MSYLTQNSSTVLFHSHLTPNAFVWGHIQSGLHLLFSDLFYSALATLAPYCSSHLLWKLILRAFVEEAAFEREVLRVSSFTLLQAFNQMSSSQRHLPDYPIYHCMSPLPSHRSKTSSFALLFLKIALIAYLLIDDVICLLYVLLSVIPNQNVMWGEGSCLFCSLMFFKNEQCLAHIRH